MDPQIDGYTGGGKVGQRTFEIILEGRVKKGC